MNDDRTEAAKESLCVWLMLVIALALLCMFGASCPVYGQAPLTDPPAWTLGWGVQVGADPIDVTIATARNLYYVAGTRRTPEIPCQWPVAGWPIHKTGTDAFTVYLVRVRRVPSVAACPAGVTSRDVFALVNHVFTAAPRPVIADVNGDGAVNGADVVRLVACVYGDAPAEPARVAAAQRVAAVVVPFGPCDKPATTAVTVRGAAHGWAAGDWLYVEYNPAVDMLRCGGTETAPLWCGPVFTARGVTTSPALEWMR